MSLETIDYSNVISTLALAAAVTALLWNIIRDFILDRIQIDFSISYGQEIGIKDTPTGVFADAGSLEPDHYFDNPKTLFIITNTGRRPICISGLGGKYKERGDLGIPLHGLPIMLQPYETFSTTTKLQEPLLNSITENKVIDIWVTDTKNKKWKLSRKGWRRLRDTADYSASNKHTPNN